MDFDIYHYTACGLDNVMLVDMPRLTGDDEDDTIIIANVNGLHRCIARGVIAETGRLTPQEIKFLRTWAGRTQEEFATLMDVTRATVNRWEKGVTAIHRNADLLIRQMVAEKLGETMSFSTAAEKAASPVGEKAYRIDASDPKNYRPKVA